MLGDGKKRWKKTLAFALAASLLLGGAAAVGPEQAEAYSVWNVYSDAMKLEKQGNYAQAIAKYEQAGRELAAGREYGNAGRMYRNAGEVYVKLYQYDKAVSSWDLESSYYAKAGLTQDSLAVKKKADALRSSVQLYYENGLSAAALKNRGRGLAPLEPANGALIGAYAEQDKQVHSSAGGKFYTDNFPKLTGKKHAGYLVYFSYGQPLSSVRTHIEKAKKNGTALELGVQPLSGLGQVKDDAYLHRLAKDAAASGVPIFLRFANEMNGNWTPWTTTPKNYIEKFRLVADVFHKEAPDNVAMVWAPGANPVDSIPSYYPGDKYVDWVGVSLYSIYNPTGDPLGQGMDRTSHIEKLDAIYKLYADRKPIMIAEGGVSYMYPEKKRDVTEWSVYQTQQLYATLPMKYPKVKGIFWFDVDSQGTGDRVKYYGLSGNAKLLAAYKKLVSSPYYLSTVGDGTTLVYSPIAQTVPAKRLKVSGYVKTWSPTLGKVVYEIGGKQAGVSTAPPWTAEIDFAKYKGKTITINVRAYDKQGKLVNTQAVKTKVQ
ncbi:glycosyl hydrolase [Saccharibacillus sp. CPCC 101409]|uniref:glycosyl hydrolase n=1 Tax=Saccharibacillus sp. CPCC 101409 TaxID=3058041 RepID=UPI00267321E6|nr:glycosyl hydrolase [Saccharibacillus sp. CPCC 101409]MDO3408231.1 glycosyl hydrolase [Saccharibacillus sp. CPCC 101409]